MFTTSELCVGHFLCVQLCAWNDRYWCACRIERLKSKHSDETADADVRVTVRMQFCIGQFTENQREADVCDIETNRTIGLS